MLDKIYYGIINTRQSVLALATILWSILHAIPEGFIIGILTIIPMWAFIILLFVKVTTDTIDSVLDKIVSE